ncbi:MAG: acid phosphatase family membrane protein YuiD [Verrucomicrobiales bacterium]
MASIDPPWYSNITIWVVVASWTLAQAIKFATAYVVSKKLDFTYFVSTGGMPSAHSAAACGLAASVGMREGFHSAVFAVSLVFAAIVMFDAQSVRRAAGKQARLLNQIVDELFKHHHLSQEKLAELLGHTRLEVFGGLVTGTVIAVIGHRVFA